MTATSSAQEHARNHIFHCRQYMDNALDALQKNEPGKAGEMLWGSVTQAVHAVDAWRGPVISGHRSLLNFANRISREIGDPAFPSHIAAAGSLHHNFYILARTVEDIELLIPGIQQAIDQILALLPPDLRDEESSSGDGISGRPGEGPGATDD